PGARSGPRSRGGVMPGTNVNSPLEHALERWLLDTWSPTAPDKVTFFHPEAIVEEVPVLKYEAADGDDAEAGGSNGAAATVDREAIGLQLRVLLNQDGPNAYSLQEIRYAANLYMP